MADLDTTAAPPKVEYFPPRYIKSWGEGRTQGSNCYEDDVSNVRLNLDTCELRYTITDPGQLDRGREHDQIISASLLRQCFYLIEPDCTQGLRDAIDRERGEATKLFAELLRTQGELERTGAALVEMTVRAQYLEKNLALKQAQFDTIRGVLGPEAIILPPDASEAS